MIFGSIVSTFLMMLICWLFFLLPDLFRKRCIFSFYTCLFFYSSYDGDYRRSEGILLFDNFWISMLEKCMVETISFIFVIFHRSLKQLMVTLKLIHTTYALAKIYGIGIFVRYSHGFGHRPMWKVVIPWKWSFWQPHQLFKSLHLPPVLLG